MMFSPQSLAYNTTLPNGNTTVFGMKSMSYGLHLFALSDQGFVVHQVVDHTPTTGVPNETQSGVWYLMPNAHQGSTPDSDQQTYDSDPAVGQNDDGRLEIFVRSHISLDFWHYYQVNASDPFSWVGPREPACLCNFPPCVDKNQTKCGNDYNCQNDGYDCTAPGFENEGPKWWNSQAIFPTSDGTFVKNPIWNVDGTRNTTGRLVLFFRGFDGGMYSVKQSIPGNSTKYDPPEAWSTLLE